MSKIAIDVVLLPDETMLHQAIDISRIQSQKFNDKILLNEDNCLPHISLAMGAIEENQLDDLEEVLQKIASNFHKFNLVADSYNSETIPSGDIVSELTVKNIPQLQSLHEMIMQNFKPFLMYDISVDMVFSPPAVEEITTYWIENYLDKSSFENFKPHITIGFGAIDDVSVPVDFTASKLAICHLGNYCTCRKILASIEIQEL
jgi:2'-5' RNA ligase